MCERKRAKRRAFFTREQLVQDKKHAGKKALLARYMIPLLPPQKPCNKETQSILNSAGTKKLKAINMLKQRRDKFQFEGKDKLNLKLTVIFTSPKSRPFFFSRNWEV